MTPPSPTARRHPVTETRFGDMRVDDYAWLKDKKWQEVMKDPSVLDPEIRAYLVAENAHTDILLEPVEGLRECLFDEMKGRIKEDDSSVPSVDGSYSYYVCYAAGGQHPQYCRANRQGLEQVMLNGDVEAKGKAFYRVAGCDHSPDHARLAYAVDLNGSEYYTIYIRDLGTGNNLDVGIAHAQGDMAWANDSHTFFYIKLDDNHRARWIYRYVVGSGGESTVVHEETEPGFYMSIGKTESRRFILLSVHDHDTSEVRLVDSDQPGEPARLVASRRIGESYSVSHRGDELLILTNADGAEDFKLITAPVSSPGRENWRDFIPHRSGVFLSDILVFERHLVRLERVDALPRIVIRRFADGEEHIINFDEAAFDLGILPGYEFDTDNLRFTYSSPTTPQRTFDYNMETRKRTLRKEQEVPSGHDSAAYVTKRLMANSHDGASVPVTVLHRADTPIDGSAPMLLYGYGSYGISMPASFVTNRLSLVDRGFVYAIAHIRGGTDRGWHWYQDGKLSKKTNTFLDYIAAAETLVEAGYARAGQIACHGGSAGGMLVGAVINMRPELFKAAVSEVPFVDVLNTMSDEDLPLTPPEWPEWGNPITDEEAYRTIRAYSPYDNVAAQAYPHVFALGGLTDARVTYWEPAKWIARLRSTRTDDNLSLLRINLEAGHAGAAGRFDRLEEVALVYAFVLMVFGMTH